jgi:hypothetical protein
MKDETEAGAIEAVASLQRRSDDLGTSTITSESTPKSGLCAKALCIASRKNVSTLNKVKPINNKFELLKKKNMELYAAIQK